MSDIEAIYEQPIEDDRVCEVPIEEGLDEANLLSGFWPLQAEEQIVVLSDTGFLVATVDKCHESKVDVRCLKTGSLRGYPEKSVWVVDPLASLVSVPKESVLMVRPLLEMKGSSSFLLIWSLFRNFAVFRAMILLKNFTNSPIFPLTVVARATFTR